MTPNLPLTLEAVVAHLLAKKKKEKKNPQAPEGVSVSYSGNPYVGITLVGGELAVVVIDFLTSHILRIHCGSTFRQTRWQGGVELLAFR